MATYKQIIQWVGDTYGVRGIATCHVAHAKELCGLPVERAWNRETDARVKPCPPEKLAYLQAAFRYFQMMV